MQNQGFLLARGVQDQGHRAVIGQGDLHVSAEDAGGNLCATVA